MSDRMVPVCRTSDVPNRQGREFEVAGRAIAIWNVNGTFHATDAVCPHAEGPLTAGFVTGSVVTCPMHAWMFDVATGRAVNPAMAPNLVRYNVVIEGDQVFIRLPE